MIDLFLDLRYIVTNKTLLGFIIDMCHLSGCYFNVPSYIERRNFVSDDVTCILQGTENGMSVRKTRALMFRQQFQQALCSYSIMSTLPVMLLLFNADTNLCFFEIRNIF